MCKTSAWTHACLHTICPLHKDLGEAFCGGPSGPARLTRLGRDTGLSEAGDARDGFDPSWCSLHLTLTPPLRPRLPLMMSCYVWPAARHMKARWPL